MKRPRTIVREALTLFGLHEAMLARKFRRDGNRLILLLHRVLPERMGCDFSPSGMVVTRDSFARALDHLGRRYRFLHPSVFFERYPEALPEPSILVTFDDGWLDVIQHALPEMSERGIGGICFVSVDQTERGELFWPERLLSLLERASTEQFQDLVDSIVPRKEDAAAIEKLLDRWKRMDGEKRSSLLTRAEKDAGTPPGGRRVASWDELAELNAAGILIGSHGMSHRLLTTLPGSEMKAEVCRSKERIAEATGEEPLFFAYPNGDCDTDVRRVVKAAEYRYAFAIGGDMKDPYHLPRVNLHNGKMRGRGGRWDADRLAWSLTAR